MSRISWATLGVLSLTGCNQYDYLRVAGFEQESFSSAADILFVVDNSQSMIEESASLARNFEIFASKLQQQQEEQTFDGLPDAVENYVGLLTDRSAFIDYQLGVTTTNVDGTEGDPADAGRLLGARPIITKDDENLAEKFNKNLLCSTVCFGDFPDAETEALIKDTCGRDAENNCPLSGDEEHLEAVYLAMCRASENPPAACFQGDALQENDRGSSLGFLRESSTLIVAVISDEGDSSRRLEQGDPDVKKYMDLYAEFGHRMSFAVIGPNCDPGVTDWGKARLQNVVNETGGIYVPISKMNGAGICETIDFADALSELGGLLRGLADAFRLQLEPIVDSITVSVDGKQVPRAEEVVDAQGNPSFSSGWRYRAADNSVVLTGDAIPEYNAEVRVYYLPVSGQPRNLPF
jgi:hypothetical protein